MTETIRHIKALKGAPDDAVAVILEFAPAGTVIQVDCQGITEALICADDIPQFHKIATNNINHGQAVIRWALPIGVATSVIKRGELVHVHNIKSQRAQNNAS